MKFKLFFSALLYAALGAAAFAGPARARTAQTTQPDPRFTVRTWTDPKGQYVITVQNVSSLYITGLVAFGSVGVGTSTRVYDSVLNQPFDRPIAPDQSHTITVLGPGTGGPGQTVPQVALKAVIFSDGSTWGDATSIQWLLSLRRWDYKYTEQAIALLEAGEKQGLSCSQLASEAEQAARENVQAAQSTDEQRIAQHAYDMVSLPLRSLKPPCPAAGPMPAFLYSHVSNSLLSHVAALKQSKPSVVPAQPGGTSGG